MAFSPPDNPEDGDTFELGGKTYVWDSSVPGWRIRADSDENAHNAVLYVDQVLNDSERAQVLKNTGLDVWLVYGQPGDIAFEIAGDVIYNGQPLLRRTLVLNLSGETQTEFWDGSLFNPGWTCNITLETGSGDNRRWVFYDDVTAVTWLSNWFDNDLIAAYSPDSDDLTWTTEASVTGDLSFVRIVPAIGKQANDLLAKTVWEWVSDGVGSDPRWERVTNLQTEDVGGLAASLSALDNRVDILEASDISVLERSEATGPPVDQVTGVEQGQIFTLAGNITGTGTLVVTTTRTGGSPDAVTVNVTSGDTPAGWGLKVRDALNANNSWNDRYSASLEVGGTIQLYIQHLTAAANDSASATTLALGTASKASPSMATITAGAENIAGVAPVIGTQSPRSGQFSVVGDDDPYQAFLARRVGPTKWLELMTRDLHDISVQDERDYQASFCYMAVMGDLKNFYGAPVKFASMDYHPPGVSGRPSFVFAGDFTCSASWNSDEERWELYSTNGDAMWISTEDVRTPDLVTTWAPLDTGDGEPTGAPYVRLVAYFPPLAREADTVRDVGRPLRVFDFSSTLVLTPCTNTYRIEYSDGAPVEFEVELLGPDTPEQIGTKVRDALLALEDFELTFGIYGTGAEVGVYLNHGPDEYFRFFLADTTDLPAFHPVDSVLVDAGTASESYGDQGYPGQMAYTHDSFAVCVAPSRWFQAAEIGALRHLEGRVDAVTPAAPKVFLTSQHIYDYCAAMAFEGNPVLPGQIFVAAQEGCRVMRWRGDIIAPGLVAGGFPMPFRIDRAGVSVYEASTITPAKSFLPSSVYYGGFPIYAPVDDSGVALINIPANDETYDAGESFARWALVYLNTSIIASVPHGVNPYPWLSDWSGVVTASRNIWACPDNWEIIRETYELLVTSSGEYYSINDGVITGSSITSAGWIGVGETPSVTLAGSSYSYTGDIVSFYALGVDTPHITFVGGVKELFSFVRPSANRTLLVGFV